MEAPLSYQIVCNGFVLASYQLYAGSEWHANVWKRLEDNMQNM